MNIEQIRIEREKAEHIVYAALDEFKSKTGLSIIGCEIETALCSQIHQMKHRPFMTGVSLKIEPL